MQKTVFKTQCELFNLILQAAGFPVVDKKTSKCY